MNQHNDLDTHTGQSERKVFATLSAQYALAGLGLVRGDPEVRGQTPYYATRWNLMIPLQSLEAAREYLADWAGRHDGQELQA